MATPNGADEIVVDHDQNVAKIVVANRSALDETPAALVPRIDALNSRVSELLLERTRDPTAHTEELPIEVGMLRERTIHQDARLSELIVDRETLRSDAAWLQETLRSLEDELDVLRTSDTVRHTRIMTLVTAGAVLVLISIIIVLIIWFSPIP